MQNDIQAEAQRIAHALKDWESRTVKGERISLSEIMAIHSGPASNYVKTIGGDEGPNLEPRLAGALDQ